MAKKLNPFIKIKSNTPSLKIPNPKECPHCGANDFDRTGDPQTGVTYIFCKKCNRMV